MTTATATDTRAEFEAYCRKWGYRLDRVGLDGPYIDRTTAALWACWRFAKGVA